MWYLSTTGLPSATRCRKNLLKKWLPWWRGSIQRWARFMARLIQERSWLQRNNYFAQNIYRKFFSRWQSRFIIYRQSGAASHGSWNKFFQRRLLLSTQQSFSWLPLCFWKVNISFLSIKPGGPFLSWSEQVSLNMYQVCGEFKAYLLQIQLLWYWISDLRSY